MKHALMIAVAVLASAPAMEPVHAQTRVIVVPNAAHPRVTVRRPVPLTIPSLDGVRNGTTRHERDIHGGPGEIYITGWPSFRGPMLRD
jgi:hypothetical protein